MFSESAAFSAIDPAIVMAYRETHYCVQCEHLLGLGDALELRIDHPSEQLKALYKLTHQTQCTFVTACNPFSQSVTDAVNVARQDKLGAELERRGLKFFPGIGQHPTNGWRGEPSYLVLGLDLEAAKSLGNRYEQNAIVWAGPDAIPQLVLLR